MMKSKGVPTISSLRKLVSNGREFVPPLAPAIFFTLVVIYLQGATIFPSGLFDKSGNLIFYNDVLFHDSNVHLSLTGELLHRFPPTNFAASGVPLKNYHYLFDVFLAVMHKLTAISVLDLYFRLVPVILSSLLCLVIYQSLMVLTKKRWACALGIFFTILATSWGPQTPFVKDILGASPVTPASNLFMTDQLLSMLVNPQGQLSLIVFLTLFLLLHHYEHTKRTITLVLFALLLGLSFGIKAYGGIVFAPAAIFSAVYFIIRTRDPKPLLAVLFGFAIMASWVALTIDRGVAGLQFAPFWLLDHMMTDLDKLNEPRFLLLKEHYTQMSNWARLFVLNLFSLAIYVFGSLGLRLFGLLGVIWLIKQKMSSPSLFFLITAAALSFTVPVLFNQSKKAYDTVQFTPYFTLFMGLMFSVTVFIFLKHLRKRRIFKAIFAVSVVTLVILLNLSEISIRFRPREEKIVIPNTTLEATEYVRTETPPNAIFLLAPTEFNRSYLIFSSLTQRRTAFSGLDFAYQVGQDTQRLRTQWESYFADGKVPADVDYLFIPAPEEDDFFRIKENSRFVTVFDNSAVKILKKS